MAPKCETISIVRSWDHKHSECLFVRSLAHDIHTKRSAKPSSSQNPYSSQNKEFATPEQFGTSIDFAIQSNFVTSTEFATHAELVTSKKFATTEQPATPIMFVKRKGRDTRVIWGQKEFMKPDQFAIPILFAKPGSSRHLYRSQHQKTSNYI